MPNEEASSERHGILHFTPTNSDLPFGIETDSELQMFRRKVMRVSKDEGLSLLALTRLGTAVSEIGRNALRYGRHARATITVGMYEGRRAIEIDIFDEGPGIANIDAAMVDGFSTKKSMGKGLGGARRLVDRFSLETTPTGTRVVMIQFIRNAQSQ